MKETNYQALNQELAEILQKLQTEDLSVDAAISLYERGTVITKELEKYLKTAENRITKAKGKSDT